jgi:hypothetical protein
MREFHPMTNDVADSIFNRGLKVINNPPRKYPRIKPSQEPQLRAEIDQWVKDGRVTYITLEMAQKYDEEKERQILSRQREKIRRMLYLNQ